MNKYFREWLLCLVVTFIILARYASDPSDKGGTTIEFLLFMSMPTLVVLLSHVFRKLLVPYVKMETAYKEAVKSPVGAGLVFLGMAVIIYALFGLFGPSARAQDVTKYIPAKATIELSGLIQEQKFYWGDHPNQAPLQD